MRATPWIVGLLAVALLAPVATAREAPDTKAQCPVFAVIVLWDGHCHGDEPGEAGCSGVVVMAFTDSSCHGGPGGDGCRDAIVVNVAGGNNCRGGDGSDG